MSDDAAKYLSAFGAILVVGWLLLNNGDPSSDAVEFTKAQKAAVGMKLFQDFPGADIRINMVGDRNLELWMPRGTIDNLKKRKETRLLPLHVLASERRIGVIT